MKPKLYNKKVQILITEDDWLKLNKIQNQLEAENPGNRQSFSAFLRTILKKYMDESES